MDATGIRQDVLDAIERYYATTEDPSAGQDDEHDAAVAIAAEFNNLDEAMQGGAQLPEEWRCKPTVEPDEALREGLALRFAVEPSHTRYIMQYARLEWLVEELKRAWTAGNNVGVGVALSQCLAVVAAARAASETVLSRLRETADEATAAGHRKGRWNGECATAECTRPARWISIHEAKLTEPLRVYRCMECCNRIDQEHAAQLERSNG